MGQGLGGFSPDANIPKDDWEMVKRKRMRLNIHLLDGMELFQDLESPKRN
jgi:hypothetical protein